MSNKWFYLVMGGVFMITMSVLLFGGFLHMMILESESWQYLTFFAFAGTSSMITGILMMFDAVNLKVKYEVGEAVKATEGDEEKSEVRKDIAEQEKRHIRFLTEKSESLRPDNFKKNRG